VTHCNSSKNVVESFILLFFPYKEVKGPQKSLGLQEDESRNLGAGLEWNRRI